MGTTQNVVLGAIPGLGSCVVFGFAGSAAGYTLTGVKDSNNNVYTITPNSPSAVQAGAGNVYLAYLLSAPANATATITASVTGALGNYVMWAVEHSISGGTASFGTDNKANSAVGTAINTPSITPANAGCLLYAAAAAGGTISAAAGGWTLGTVVNGDADEYTTSSGTGATAVNWTEDSAGWSAVAMSITFTTSASTPVDDDSYRVIQVPQVEPTICVW